MIRKRYWLREEKKESRKNLLILLLSILLFISIGILLFNWEGITGASIGVPEPQDQTKAQLCGPVMKNQAENGLVKILDAPYCVGLCSTGTGDCPAGQVCVGEGNCIAGWCNAAYACSPGAGDNNYGAGGNYKCRATCDGNGNCDYATSCVNCNSYSTCSGSCPDCVYYYYSCSAGSCSYSSYDPDWDDTYCTSCSQWWAIGGEVAAATCCGDDSGEKGRECIKDEGVIEDACAGSGGELDACCDQSTDCVFNDSCYADASSHPDYSNVICNEGTWEYGMCGTLNSNITLYKDLNSSGTCFIVNASGITIDCAGYQINYSTSGIQGYGINNTGFNNTIVKNCNLLENNSNGNPKHAIYFNGIENGTIENNKITTVGTSSYGIYLSSSSNLELVNNNISANQTYEIFDETGDSYINYLIYNSSDGEIKWTNDSDGGFLKNLTLNGSIEMETNLFIGSIVIALNTSVFSDSRINSSANLTLSQSDLGQLTAIKRVEYYSNDSSDILSNGADCNGTTCFTISFNNLTGYLKFNTSSFSSFTVSGNRTPTADSVSIISSDSLNRTNGTLTGSWTFSDADGDPETDNETQWYNDTEEVTDLQNFTSVHPDNTTKGENWTFSVRVYDNISWSDWVNASMEIGNTAPTQSTPIINSTFGTNTSSENLTVYNVSTDDNNSDPIKNIFDWRLNGTSIAVLNMPFEKVNDAILNATKDYSMFSNDGSEAGGVAWNSTGGYDSKGAFEFDGIDDFIIVPFDNSLDVTNSLTIAAWINPKRTPPIVSKIAERSDVYYLHLTFDGVIDFRTFGTSDDSTASATVIGLNKWTHVTAVFDGSAGTRTIYLNGSRDTYETGITGTIDSNTQALYIGNNIDGNRQWNGTLDDLMIFNYSLSPEQVLNLYNNRTDFLSWNDTNREDNWSACIIPNDGTEDGAEVCSENLTILNTLPEASNLIINSTLGTNTSSENITVYFDIADNDSDDVKNITNWKLNGTSITVLNMPFENSNSNKSGDYSGYENNATTNTATWNSTGGYDGKGAFEFDGSDDYISVGGDDSLKPTEEITISAWIKISKKWDVGIITNTDTYTICTSCMSKGYNLRQDAGEGFDYDPDTNGSTAFAIGNGTNVTYVYFNLSTNIWHHVVGTYDSSGIRLYVNGELKQSSSYIGSINYDSLENTSIGAMENSTVRGAFFNGTVDDVMIFNRSLSAEQVKAIYENKSYMITASETSKGDNWSACIIPNDGYEDGAGVCSENLTVLNTPPETTAVTLNATSANNYPSDDLTCYATFADNDSDLIYANYTWYMNGVANLSGQSTTTFSVGSLVNVANLSSGNTTAGEKWSCQVQAYDSTDYEGSWTESSNLTIAAVPPPEEPGGTSPPSEAPAPPAAPPAEAPAEAPSEAPAGPSYSSSGSVRRHLQVTQLDVSNVTRGLNRTNVSFVLTNTGDQNMILEPDVEDLEHNFLVHRRTLNYKDSWASRMSGIWYSNNDVFGTLLKAKIKKEQIVLKPGETKKIELDIQHPKLLVGSNKVKVILRSLGEIVLEENVTIENEAISLAALDLVPGENLLDIYASISSGEKERSKEERGLLTGAVITGERVKDSEEYWFEININKKRESKILGIVPMKFILGKKIAELFTSEVTGFADLYGPFLVKGNQSLVFAQQLKFDPRRYYGEHLVKTRIIKGGEVLVENNFYVFMEGGEIVEEVAEKEPLVGKAISELKEKGKEGVSFLGLWLVPVIVFLIVSGFIICWLIFKAIEEKEENFRKV